MIVDLHRRYWKGRYTHVQGMIPINADGTPFIPGGAPVPPTTPGGGGGGGGTDPGPGTEQPPGEEPPDTDPTADYVDGSCQ